MRGVRKRLRKARGAAVRWFYRGDRFLCPVCERTWRSFAPYGRPARSNARCLHCGALERHRMVWQFLASRTDLFEDSDGRVLHFAPEGCFEPRLRALLGDRYVTADIESPRAAVNLDIMALPFADRAFDALLCSHVLEHVPDDRRALRECFRVLRPGGWAVFLVPVTVGRTVEDPSVVDPAERLRRFGQEDHVRRYGPDFEGRLLEAGFVVTPETATDFLETEERVRTGIHQYAGTVYHCEKPAGAPAVGTVRVEASDARASRVTPRDGLPPSRPS